MFRFSHSAEMYGCEVTAENTTTAEDITEVIEAFNNFLRGCGMLAADEYVELVSEPNLRSDYDSEPVAVGSPTVELDEASQKAHDEAYDAGYDHGMADVEELRRIVEDTGHDVAPYFEGYAAAISDNA